MNGQPPPTDPYLHDQLARRSSSRLPPGLVADVMAAVDGISVEKPGRSALRFALSPTRRTLAAGASLAVVAAMAVALVAVPLLRQPPTGGPSASLAGYPADRALTTAELARIMAGPALPTNTALVAAVTIDARSDVCPMNRYPTLGVIEGAGSQICVMAGTLAALSSGDLTTGTFAFRYLGPGYLGMLARIAPASSSRLAFGVTDSWPQNGDAVLVEGYLGTTPQPCDAAETPLIGDVLDPVAYEACSWSWLSEDGSPAPVLNVPTPDSSSTASPRPSIDTLALTGKARHVWVGGARQIDSIPTATTYGVYVVRVATGPCPGASPIDSYGCAFWSVVAKVPNLTLDEPVVTPSPGPSTSPDRPVQPSPSLASGATLPGLAGSGGRPLTQVEFVNAWAADPDHLAGRIVITKGPIPSGFSASPGTCQAILPMGEIAADGYWAVSVGADGRLSIVGELTLDPTGRFVWSLDSVNQSASAGDLVLVDGWLLATLTPGCETVDTPRPSSCGPYSILSTAATENVEHSVGVQRDAYFQITGKAGDYLTGGATPVQGIFLVRLDSNVKGMLLAGFELSYPPD